MFNIPFNCTGCHACANICPKNCISMIGNNEGFLYPKIDQNQCIECGQCEKVCPVINKPIVSKKTVAVAVKNIIDEERNKSSSGGVFSLLANFVLSKGGVVVGAAYDENFLVRHIIIENADQIRLLQGAKYSQSRIGNSYFEIKKFLQSGRVVLFSGTPCQCSGLINYLGKDYENLVMIDLICHGVPSPKVWQLYIDFRSSKENNGNRPITINMRSKISGWSRYGYSTEFDYGNGYVTRIHNSQDLFMKIFVGNLCLRNSCSNCIEKGTERCSDFTIGDYWGVWNQYPEIDDDKGVSIVFIHSEKGKKILQMLKDKIVCVKVDLDTSYKENPSMVLSSKAHENRTEFFNRLKKDVFEELVYEYLPLKIIKKAGIFQRAKGKLKRIFIKRID